MREWFDINLLFVGFPLYLEYLSDLSMIVTFVKQTMK